MSGERKPRLSVRQRQILEIMKGDDIAMFPGGTRGFGHRIAYLDGERIGVVIHAYQSPEYFLQNRDLLKAVETNFRGRWYRITDAGKAAISRGKSP